MLRFFPVECRLVVNVVDILRGGWIYQQFSPEVLLVTLIEQLATPMHSWVELY